MSFFSRTLNYLYPSACPSCNLPSDNFMTAPFCNACWSGIKRYDGPACRICALPFASPHSKICGKCLEKAPFFSRAVSFGLYDETLAAAINHFKFHGIRRLYRPLGKFLFDFGISPDAVTAVPLSIKGLRERGFNQSLLLAKAFSEKVGARLLTDALWKVKETPPQVGLSAKARAANLRGAFRVSGNVSGLKVLVIDDVMTTGATLNECSRELAGAGAAEIIVMTLARAGAE